MKLLTTYNNSLSLEKLAAIHADGIIVAQQDFSHRFKDYLSDLELVNILNRATSLNLEVYLNINRIINEEELVSLEKYLKNLPTGLSGIYFNDLSILYYSKELGLVEKCIYDPDTLLTNSNDINYYLQQGLKGTVISKEITMEEISLILGNTQEKLHLTIHGRLNMSYSRRHFLKSYYDFLNKDYDLDNKINIRLRENTREYLMPIYEDKHGTSIYTDFTLESFNEIQLLANANLAYGIIDSLFLSSDEVYDAIIGYYSNLNGLNFDSDAFITKYSVSRYTTGYHYQKTNLVK